jgi:ubiquinone/menaquinone biosynthesis C-methylase UbiE
MTTASIVGKKTMSDHSHQDDQTGHYQLSEHAQKNRALWEAVSDSYEQMHAGSLSNEKAMAWGLWRIPESELHILGEVAGKDILELGCGAARWSIALAQKGARPVGLDFSSKQLQHARGLMQEAGVDFPLIEASAEDVPLPDTSFDIVFCDWGAMTFCDPQRTVPEAARLLRPGGLFTFSTATPVELLCQDLKEDQITERLINDYFGMRRFEWEDEVNFQLTYGDWIRLFRSSGFVVEDLIETRPAEGATSTYRTEAENAWARRWPMENIWKLRKEP